MEYEISNEYPVPGTYVEQFPFSQLEPGQSFFVPGEVGQTAKFIQTRIWAAFKRFKDERNIAVGGVDTEGYSIATRTVPIDNAVMSGDFGVRVWRLP